MTEDKINDMIYVDSYREWLEQNIYNLLTFGVLSYLESLHIDIMNRLEVLDYLDECEYYLKDYLKEYEIMYLNLDINNRFKMLENIEDIRLLNHISNLNLNENAITYERFKV